MPWVLPGFAKVSRILLLHASRWDFWRRSIGLDVGRTGLSLFSGYCYSIALFPALSVCAFLWDYNSTLTKVGFHMDQFFLETPRLGFRHWSNADLPIAQALWGDAEVTRFIGGPWSKEKVQERLSAEIELASTHNVQYWPIFLLETREHAGCAGLRPYRTEACVYELGVHLRPFYWGQGLAEEASRAVIKHAFENIGAKALFAGHHPANAASQHLLLKLGFRHTHEEFYAPTGLHHPSYLLESSLRA